MKKWLVSFFAVIMVLSISVMADENKITVEINSNPVVFDVQPQIINDRTMVPMRKIFESLGAVVTWDQESKTVTGKKDDTIINISVDSFVLFKNGSPVVLDTAPVIIDGRTLVPVRAVAESFDCDVGWDPDTRTVSITTLESTERPVLNAAEIAEKDANAVFYIEVYNSSGAAIASGSGFFISPDGTAVTNYHVIEGTNAAYIMTISGQVFEISEVIKHDQQLDVAVIRVSRTDINGDTVSAFPFLELGNSNNVKTGQVVYALGSPLGVQNTISNGIVSNAKQVVDGVTYIQTTAAISHGSSGGALVDEYGDVIGITSAGIEDGENIGFAIPINVINSLDKDTETLTYEEFAELYQSLTLEISETEISVELGSSATIYVYAGGTSSTDWSIFWESSDNNTVTCEWGDWLDDYPDICPLYVYGEAVGKVDICIYSSMEAEPKHCTVNVTKPKVNTLQLEFSDTDINVDQGGVATLYVTARGAEDLDWTIYCNSSNETIADCEWGEWLKDKPDVCELYVYGLSAGEAYISVSSDVESQPQYCKVTVNESKPDPLVLKLSHSEVNVEPDNTAVIYVTTSGGEDIDWTISCNSGNKKIVECEWGEWLEDEPNVCPLYIYGLSAGETYVSVTSNVGSAPAYCRVTVSEPEIEFYPGTTIPTYTYFSGIECEEIYEDVVYTYPLDENIVDYVSLLYELGYELIEESEETYGYSLFFLDDYGNYISVVLSSEYNKTWIYPSHI